MWDYVWEDWRGVEEQVVYGGGRRLVEGGGLVVGTFLNEGEREGESERNAERCFDYGCG